MAVLETADGRDSNVRRPRGGIEGSVQILPDLYKADEETEEVLSRRRLVIDRIDRRLSGADNAMLEEVPSEELITTIVMEMPKEKSRGTDG
ncbi:hypothetical protein R1sor_013988 [Riccia sorocarpa]|uniref:Uncharacterized protein n=1 Tax=Riccia sorocarpa TaxID=122646 RepID=A0ABD3HEB1_9MARC